MAHVTNVVSYSRLVDICSGHGGNYKPGNGNLQLKAMRALLEKAQSSLHDVSQKRNALSEITNERARMFSSLNALVGKVIRTLKASQVGDDTLANARYYSRLINGVLKSRNGREPIPSEEADADPPVGRTLTQRSYVAKAYNFGRLAQLIQGVEGYATQSEELKPAGLLETARQLEALNGKWSQARVALKNARIYRNAVLYKGKGALVHNGAAVKDYLRAEFGPRGEESSRLTEIGFTKPLIR
ncbi:MAG: hypothetical protein AB7K37_16850 [Cyclobacteriaceae bacterium]